jgi:hypothetical protein
VQRRQIDALIDLGLAGVTRLAHLQNAVLARAGVDLNALART